MDDLTGKTFGRYHILEPLGEGGMAVVYKGYDTQVGRNVAIKIIQLDEFAPRQHEKLRQRFKREAQALAKLSHPNIVAIIDYGNVEGILYLVMPLLEGGTLVRFSNRKLPYADAARLLAPIARALDFAHRHNILHRDVKLANILLTEDGQPMLSDFGIAKILEEHVGETLTGTNLGIGTPEYMAPEQWEGKAGPQSDQYALGAAFFELLTGRKPYIADTSAALMVKHITEPLPSFQSLVPGLPAEVEFIVSKAMAKKSTERYTSMAEFATVLEGLASGTFTMLMPPKNERISPPGAKTYEGIAPSPEKVAKRRIPIWAWGLVGGVFLGALTLIVFSLGGIDSLLGTKNAPGPVNTTETLPVSSVSGQKTTPESGETEALPAGKIPVQTVLPIRAQLPSSASTVINTLIAPPSPTLGIGSTRVSNNDSMIQAYVPDGQFEMGSNKSFADAKPLHTVWLDAFWVDTTEVTNAQYTRCVTAGGCTEPKKGFRTNLGNNPNQSELYYGNPQYDDFPVGFVDWSQANAYCQWAGRKLPTEAQWEKAARGIDGRTYPWGEGIGCDKANYEGCVGVNSTKVGSYTYGVSPYGAFDMTGNVMEWVADWYDADYYKNSPKSNSTGPQTGRVRVYRGGSFYNTGFKEIPTFGRNNADPKLSVYHLGFRCVESSP